MSTSEQDQPGQSVIGQPLERDDGWLKVTSRRVRPPIRRWTILFTVRCCPTPPTVIRPDLGQPRHSIRPISTITKCLNCGRLKQSANVWAYWPSRASMHTIGTRIAYLLGQRSL